MEIWKNVIGYENYQVSSLGNVKSYYFKTPRNLKTIDSGNGYLVVTLRKNKKSKTKLVHRIVLSAFVENPLNKPQVNHIDGIKANNKIENLEWCTCSENQLHAVSIGIKNNAHGETHPKAKLTEKEVLEIRASDMNNSKLGRIYGVHRISIRDIKNRINWKHI